MSPSPRATFSITPRWILNPSAGARVLCRPSAQMTRISTMTTNTSDSDGYSTDEIFDDASLPEDEDLPDPEEVHSRFERPGPSQLPSEIVMECAGCGGDWTHQFKAEVFFRDEDAKRGEHVTVRHGETALDHDATSGPSHRRSGISVWFWCELCDVVTRLDVIQSKGQTHIKKGPDDKVTEEEKLVL